MKLNQDWLYGQGAAVVVLIFALCVCLYAVRYLYLDGKAKDKIIYEISQQVLAALAQHDKTIAKVTSGNAIIRTQLEALIAIVGNR